MRIFKVILSRIRTFAKGACAFNRCFKELLKFVTCATLITKEDLMIAILVKFYRGKKNFCSRVVMPPATTDGWDDLVS